MICGLLWVGGVVILWCGDFFDYCKIMIILIGLSTMSDFPLIW